MKKSICVVGISIGLAAYGISIEKIVGTYEAPNKECYSDLECEFISRENNATLVIPASVTNITQASFAGPLI